MWQKVISLDFITMNKDALISGLEDGGCLGTNDHNLIMFNMWCMCLTGQSRGKNERKKEGGEAGRNPWVDVDLRTAYMSKRKLLRF